VTPVVLVHGVGLDRTMWKPVCARLANRHEVITYDLLGHGDAPKPAGPYSLAMFVEQLASGAPAKAVVVGFSLGALIAQGYAVAHPDRVDRLVLLNSVFDRSRDDRAAIVERVAAVRAGGYPASIDAAIDRWFTPEFARAKPDAVAAVRARLERNDVRAYADAYEVFAMADAELVESCGTITCPTLVITGSDDPRSTPDMTRSLAAAIRGAQAVVVPGVRHMVPVEKPELTAELIERETAGQ
jgi:pimeloyl-ACP methyl ester carboxylesterase